MTSIKSTLSSLPIYYSLFVIPRKVSLRLEKLQRDFLWVGVGGRRAPKKASFRWCLFFWLFAESNLVLEFRLFVFLLFHDLL